MMMRTCEGKKVQAEQEGTARWGTFTCPSLESK